MTVDEIIAAVTEATKLIPVLFQLGENVAPFIANLRTIIAGTALTDDQRTSLNTQIDALHAQVQAPMTDESGA